MDVEGLALSGLAAVAAGAVNALAGGGTLITFPALVALGVPAVAANVTNTVALTPGYLGATLAQSADLRDQRGRMWGLIPAAALGGVAGAALLLRTEERIFRELIPVLILLASFLLAVQDPVRRWLLRRKSEAGDGSILAASLPVAIASVYGGYFGAGLSVILLAVLGLLLEDSLTRLNALKQSLSFAVNVAAAAFFVFSGQVLWPVALVMAVGALLGGVLGGRLAGRIQPSALRWIVVVIGCCVAAVYLLH